MKLIWLILLMFSSINQSLLGQNSNIELTFTAINGNTWIELDSLKIINQSQEGDTTLYYPDTTLVLNFTVGISKNNLVENTFNVHYSYSQNGFEHAIVSVVIPEHGYIDIIVSDVLGKRIIASNEVLDRGNHFFRFTPGNQRLYFFSVCWNGQIRTIKIPRISNITSSICNIEFIKSAAHQNQFKSLNQAKGFKYNLGDTLLHVCYMDSIESGILDAPDTNSIYTFQLVYGIPCPGTPTVSFEGQIYNTVQMGSQCWLKENLNVGTMIPGVSNMQDNEILEKYCYDDDTANCGIYGGLYQWDEMMQYRTQPGAQGICPPGWHIPTDEEWKILEGATDSWYGIGDIEWDESYAYRGADAGNNLKTTSGWFENNGMDLYGFSVLPGGNRYYDGTFYVLTARGLFWTSSEYLSNNSWAWNRGFTYVYGLVGRYDNNPKNIGFSVRCVKD